MAGFNRRGDFRGGKKRAASDDQGDAPRASKKGKATEEGNSAPAAPELKENKDKEPYISVSSLRLVRVDSIAHVPSSATTACDASQSENSRTFLSSTSESSM